MSRTFTELVNKNVGKLFNTFQGNPELTGFIVNGVPVALRSALRKMMIDNPEAKKEIVIGDVCKFTLAISKRGDSLAITPGFELLESGLNLIGKDDFEVTDREIEALSISIIDDQALLYASQEAMAGKDYNDVEWADIVEKGPGLKFSDESDTAVAFVSYILTVMEVLSNNKDSAQEVEYEVPGLGTFKVKEDKGKWVVSLSYDKAYKAGCKSDALINAVSTLELE